MFVVKACICLWRMIARFSISREVLMMEAMELIHLTVMHKMFGKGVICSADEKYIEVDFSEKNKVSKFAYPICFQEFLTLENSKMHEKMQKVVETWKIENGIDKKEEIWKRHEKTVQEIKDRQLAAAERKLKSAQRAISHRTAYNSVKQEKQK